MTIGEGEAAEPEGPRRKRVRRRRVSAIGLAGEILITAGVLILGYIGWQPIWSATIISSHQRDVASEQSQQWLQQAQSAAPTPDPTAAPPDYSKLSADPPVGQNPADYATFGVLYVPRFSSSYAVPIGQTTSLPEVLNDPDIGIGHYEDTQLPGQVGNFAMAAHRSGPIGGNPFRDLDFLRVGDPIYVETSDGWYTYTFRSFEYVLPTQVDVLDQVPHLDGVPGTDRLLTMTTCNPKWAGSDERMIGYAVYSGFRPLGDPPPELLAVNPNLAQSVGA